MLLLAVIDRQNDAKVDINGARRTVALFSNVLKYFIQTEKRKGNRGTSVL